jgi:two-component system sensor histidine kinase KdpD
LVHNLIETTRLESGAVRLKKEPQAIEEVVGSALERLDKQLTGREVKTSFPEELPMVPLDAVLLEQVFINLIENAARHTPSGTPIDISGQIDESSLRIEVADRGPGLSAEELEKAFDKFYRANTPAAGAGLGLAICKAIVEAHGGHIGVENRAGGGAVFKFTLPLGEHA